MPWWMRWRSNKRNAAVPIFYEDFEVALNKFISIYDGPILIAHTDFKITNQAVKEIRKNHKGIIGAYPNNGFFEKPYWNTTEDILPNNYCEEAKLWIESGAQIIGGCCGIGPSHIKALSDLG